MDGFDTDERRAWEQRCLALARDGDRAAFTELYSAFAPLLYRRVLLPRLGRPDVAEDALAETFRTFLEHLDRIEDQGKSLWFWLARVAINKANDLHRGRGRTAKALTSFESLLAPLRSGSGDPESLAFEEADARETKNAVEAVLREMNPRYRRAIELRFLQDRSRDECAEMLEVKLGTFDVLLLRALRSFRKIWETTHGASEAIAQGAEARADE